MFWQDSIEKPIADKKATVANICVIRSRKFQ